MNDDQQKSPVSLSYSGPTLLNLSILNKGCAFSKQEREDFDLLGLLPERYETIDQQVIRAYQQYSSFDEPINKHIYLRAIQDSNETLFYRLVNDHIDEMMPIIYTPTVGEACERFSEIYRRARGLFIAYPERDNIDAMLANVTKQNIKVIVVTDGSRILGLGDQGIGGMGIPIGKLSLYTACGGISPAYTLPITLDVGTDNPDLLADPLYMGWQHPRVSQPEYDAFLALFIDAVKRRWPSVFLQFEDFNQTNALPLLKRYRDQICCFNDDIQGTAVVTVGTLLSACRVQQRALRDQRIIIAGAGSAGCGIAEHIIKQMCSEGLDESTARDHVFMIDREGLLLSSMAGLRDFQLPLSKDPDRISQWQCAGTVPTLLETAEHVNPTILIGVSGQAGLFNQTLISTIQAHCKRPIILPLSNPSKQIEATPEQLLQWTHGEAIIATGSPFDPIVYQDKQYAIPQCNNSYIFPGFGLAVVAAKIQFISDEMLIKAGEVLADCSPAKTDKTMPLLPALTDIKAVSRTMAFEVAKVAMEQNLAEAMSDDALLTAIDEQFWQPEYRQYQRIDKN